MCGIAGLLSGGRTDVGLAGAMADALFHRGPDDGGTWTDAEAGVGLGHRRLAIVDLSANGHQPMVSADGRWVIAFNGEVYNHRDLREDLNRSGDAPAGGWRGDSDTETLLHHIAVRGLHRALEGAVGMFAFALWDKAERRLRLVRDRFGEKPLYYGWVGGDFLFASELKSFLIHPRFDNKLSQQAVETFVARTYIPAPLSIYRRVFKLLPGCILELGSDAASCPREVAPVEGVRDGDASLSRYWSYAAVVERGLADPIVDEFEAIEQLEHALATAIRGQAMADVPIGAFLSGGIDSSTVVALYQKHSPVPVRSFTIGFHESGFNEAHYAKAVAQDLGAEHHELYVSAEDAMGVIPALPAMYDEPFADSSQIPTYLVSRFARQEVTVALSGDGGDELLCGYSRYGEALRLWGALDRVPLKLRAAAAAPLRALPAALWNGAGAMMRIPPHRRFASRARKALKIAGSARNFDDVYTSLLHQWPFEQAPAGEGRLSGMPFNFGGKWPDVVRAMYGDAIAYLPDDILCKVDRAAMAVSLETRVPFLDHRVAEVAARIPLAMKLQGGRGKAILRKLLARELPTDRFERPKAGFALPVGDWLIGPLRDWAEDLLDPRRMDAEGWFDSRLVQQRWTDHLSGRRSSAEAMWAILMFQAWLCGPAATANANVLEMREANG